MKKNIVSIIAVSFLISCGPSKMELEAYVKQQEQEKLEQIGNKMETQEFYDNGNHCVTVHIVEINGCTWFQFCNPNGLTTIHNPHCTKTATE